MEVYYKALHNLVPYSVNNVKVVYYRIMNVMVIQLVSILNYMVNLYPKTNSEDITFSDEYFYETQWEKHSFAYRPKICIEPFFTDYFPGTQRWKMSLKLAC